MFLRPVLPCLPCLVVLAACESTPSHPSPQPPQPPHASEVPTTSMPKPNPTTAALNGTTPKDETPPPSAPTTATIAEDVRAANAFTFKMLGRTKKPTDNAMISGTSLRFALSSPYVGARGTTAREMATALSLDADANAAARIAHAELGAWEAARGSAELSIANRLWVDDDLTLLPDFTKIAATAFGAAPASIDYAKPEDARTTINGWIAQNTKNKITDLLPQGSIEPSTRLVVTNAIWFKARWEFPFPKSATKDEPFKLAGAGKKTVTVPSMHLTDTFRVAQLQGLKVLEMRYAESRLAMLVVLPDESSSLAKVEAGLDGQALTQWNAALSTARVNVTLPRFTFRYGGSMNAPLQELGMRVAFTDKADFGGIAETHGTDRLFLGSVFHQTWISVDELGTEAAAATAATMRTTSLLTGPVVDFRADHPFLFVITDTKEQRVLFAGRVAQPTL